MKLQTKIAVVVGVVAAAAAAAYFLCRPCGEAPSQGRPAVVREQEGKARGEEAGAAARRERKALEKKPSIEERRRAAEERRAKLMDRKREEGMDLRSAALKARAQYERTMGAEALSGRRRSLSYWMGRVRRERERAAGRDRRHSAGKGADAGAEAAGLKDETKSKVKARKE